VSATLEVRDLAVEFDTYGGVVQAVRGVDFAVEAGRTLAVVGESGCGKSTLSRAVLQLIGATGGRIVWQGEDLSGLSRKAMNERRRHLGVVFQDPLSSLNPRMTIGSIIAEPLRRFYPEMGRKERDAAVLKALRDVGLDREHRGRYPHEFSGGQCQRASIARAMIVKPKLLVCDEPVSSLDVSTRRQIIRLLQELGAGTRWRSSSSATIFRWCGWCATGFWSCTWAASWKPPIGTPCSIHLRTPTRRR